MIRSSIISYVNPNSVCHSPKAWVFLFPTSLSPTKQAAITTLPRVLQNKKFRRDLVSSENPTQPNSTQPIGVQGVLGVCITLCANHQLHLYIRYKCCVWGKASLGFKSLFWGKELNKLNRVSQFD